VTFPRTLVSADSIEWRAKRGEKLALKLSREPRASEVWCREVEGTHRSHN
jgi:hypothetical protein